MTETPSTLRDTLRSFTVFPDDLPTFDTAAAPIEPEPLFISWLAHAGAAGQLAPHALTVSTGAADGGANSRVVILTDVDDSGWHFATHSTSPKAIDIAGDPRVSLTFFWPVVGRQVRVSGVATRLPEERAAADFRARPIKSRAATLVGRQSEELGDSAEYAEVFADALARLEADPELVDPGWTIYAVRASSVEFWQASRGRDHTRLRYDRTAAEPATPAPATPADPAVLASTWTRRLLWP